MASKMQAASKYRKTKATADDNTDNLTCCGLIRSLQLMRRALAIGGLQL
jgi:hypothetical protein